METSEGTGTAKITPTITIDEFGKIELCVATIKAVEPHPKADRLLVLKIDLYAEHTKFWILGCHG